MTTNEPEISIEALNKAIDRRGWTPAKLSKKSGVSKGMISLLLQGDRPNASALVVAKLAQSLEVSIDHLMGLTSNFAPNVDMGQGLAELLSAAQKLSYLRQRELLAIAEALLKIERSADVESIYSEMMNLITRLAEIDGGKEAFDSLVAHIASLTEDDPDDEIDDHDGATGPSPAE